MIQDDHKKSLADAAEYVRKLQIISISSKEKEDDKEETESPEDVFIANQKLRELLSLYWLTVTQDEEF